MTPTIQHHQFIVGNNPDPVDDEINAQAAIRAAAWWNRCEVQERWPLSTDEATELLVSAGEHRLHLHRRWEQNVVL